MSINRQLIHEVLIKDKSTPKANRIYLTKSSGGTPEAFDVIYENNTKKTNVKEGSTCICYDAVMPNENLRSGKLKEFYPADIENDYFLIRREDNVLCTNPGIHSAAEKFINARKEFVDSYISLRETIEIIPDMKSFIPEFTLYYSSTPTGDIIENGTVYIWTSNEPMQTFDEYLKYVREDPAMSPEHKLFVILNTILNLTECVDMMHEAGLLHLDVKPTNFGFKMRGETLLLDAISLFDTNSVLYTSKKPSVVRGTDGYSAPEIAISPNPKSDIYSIGATLFEAIVIHDDVKKPGFNDDFYAQIPDLVRESKLIQASDNNSDTFLVDTIIHILTSCLNDFDHKRPTAQELIEKLKQAISRIIPGEYNLILSTGKKLTYQEIEALMHILDKKIQRDAKLVIQQHLFEYPLYEFCHRSPEDLNKCQDLRVLIVGFGNFGQQFLDTALPLSMMYNTNVQFHIVSENKQERSDGEVYLGSRSALKDFININNGEDPDAYGRIKFETFSYEPGNNDAFLEYLVDTSPQYIFIALGDDALNIKMANEWAEWAEQCSVNFVLQNKKYDTKAINKKIHPVYVNSNPRENPNFKLLEQMAYGCHMLWNSSSNENPSIIRKKFINDKYNYLSSISNAVSIPYKLASVGIIESNPSKAAEMYDTIVNSKENSEIKNEMIACEQHRWALDKICSEHYACLRDYDEAVRLGIETGKVYDKKNKRHVCIVKSTASQNLLSVHDWDEKISVPLDELDTVSIELHRAFKRRADKLRENEPLTSDTVKRIRKLISDNHKAQAAFDEWFRIMTFIWHRKKGYVKRYDDLKNKFQDSLKGIESKRLHELKSLIDILHSHFYPICQSLAYTNYKKYDADMVEKVPFILTYSDHIHIAVPLLLKNNDSENNDTLFKNIAQSIILNPYKITYIYHIDDKADIDKIENAITFICNIISAKHLKSTINLIFTCRNSIFPSAENLRNLASIHSRIANVRVLPCEDEEISEIICDLLESRQCKVSAIEYNKNYRNLFAGSSRVKKYPTFEFDSKNKCFSSKETSNKNSDTNAKYSNAKFDCRHFTYYSNDQYLTVNDVFGSKLSTGKTDKNIDLFRSYSDIFKNIYRKNTRAWKSLCRKLGEHTLEQNKLAEFPFYKDGIGENLSAVNYVMPSFTYQAVEKIISRLKKENIVSEKSYVKIYNSDSIYVTIESKETFLNEIMRMFSDPYRLFDVTSIIFKPALKKFTIYMNGLIVKGLVADKWEYDILCALKKQNLIYNFGGEPVNDNFTCSFVISSAQVKDMLTKEGEILELYCYSQLVGNKEFSDVVTSYEINWGKDENDEIELNSPQSEFDIVVTRGFKMLFIECKAAVETEQGFYYRIKTLCNKFGIQATAVIISDTLEETKYNPFADVNSTNRTIGNDKDVDVITVYKNDDILKIRDTLVRILDGTFQR